MVTESPASVGRGGKRTLLPLLRVLPQEGFLCCAVDWPRAFVLTTSHGQLFALLPCPVTVAVR
jgi:hypothetical protein